MRAHRYNRRDDEDDEEEDGLDPEIIPDDDWNDPIAPMAPDWEGMGCLVVFLVVLAMIIVGVVWG